MRKKTAEETDWLYKNAPMHPRAETLNLFEKRFGWAPPISSLSSWMCDHGIKASNAPMKWTPIMDAFFRDTVPGHTEGQIRDMFEARFGIVLTESQIGNRKTHLGLKSGTHGGCFEKGAVPANKGKTWEEMGIPVESQASSRSTCFKKGDVPPNHRPVGSERVDKDGYIYVKVRNDRDPNGYNDHRDLWKLKHRLVWEQANGPVPDGHVIIFCDRDKSNCNLDNLMCIPMSVNAVLNRADIDYYDRTSAEAAVATARLMSKINEKACSERACKSCGTVFRPEQPRQRRCRRCIDGKALDEA